MPIRRSAIPLPRPSGQAAFRLVLALTGLNLLIDMGGWMTGLLGRPHGLMLGDPPDMFADFFKVILSYPGGQAIRTSVGGAMGQLLTDYAVHNPYGGVPALAQGGVTHLHMTPLSTLGSLLALRASTIVDPVALFVAGLLLLLAWVWSIAGLAGRDRSESIHWLLALVLSYPALLMVARGNLFAGAGALSAIHAVLLAARGRPAAAALLLAVVLNIRPNAAILAPALLLLSDRPWRAGAMLGAATVALFAASLAAAHLLYPDYRLTSFLAGLGRYHEIYVVESAGQGLSSSAFGAFRLILGYAAWEESAGLMLGCAVVLAGVMLWSRGLVGRAGLAFLLGAAYALASTIFADYHLLALFAPAMLLTASGDRTGRAERPDDPAAGIVFLGSLVVTAPRSYAFLNDVSLGVVAGPVLLVGFAAALVLVAAGRRSRSLAAYPLPA